MPQYGVSNKPSSLSKPKPLPKCLVCAPFEKYDILIAAYMADRLDDNESSVTPGIYRIVRWITLTGTPWPPIKFLSILPYPQGIAGELEPIPTKLFSQGKQQNQSFQQAPQNYIVVTAMTAPASRRGLILTMTVIVPYLNHVVTIVTMMTKHS